MSLKAAKPKSRDHKQNISGFNVFVTGLHEKTKPRDVARYRKSVFGKNLKAEQLKNKYPGNASLKVKAETSHMMTALLNKNNWTDGVFVKEINRKSKN